MLPIFSPLSDISLYLKHYNDKKRVQKAIDFITTNKDRIGLSNGEGWLSVWFLMGRDWQKYHGISENENDHEKEN